MLAGTTGNELERSCKKEWTYASRRQQKPVFFIQRMTFNCCLSVDDGLRYGKNFLAVAVAHMQHTGRDVVCFFLGIMQSSRIKETNGLRILFWGGRRVKRFSVGFWKDYYVVLRS